MLGHTYAIVVPRHGHPETPVDLHAFWVVAKLGAPHCVHNRRPHLATTFVQLRPQSATTLVHNTLPGSPTIRAHLCPRSASTLLHGLRPPASTIRLHLCPQRQPTLSHDKRPALPTTQVHEHTWKVTRIHKTSWKPRKRSWSSTLTQQSWAPISCKATPVCCGHAFVGVQAWAH